MNLKKGQFLENFKIAYRNLYNLHPQLDNEDFKFRYLRVDWFFPNHLDNVLSNIKLFADKYFSDQNIDIESALFGGLFHDAGLVYERKNSDSTGHENRSVEYAVKELKSLGYDEEFIEKVSECIKTTEPDYNSKLPEALLVRNADAYAHIMSMHFFGKANFAKNIHDYVDWFDEKIAVTFSKLTIEELIKDSNNLITCYRNMIDNYRKNKERDFLGEMS